MSSSTCGFGFIGVACSERVPCQEIESATKTSMFQGFLTSVMRCKGRYPQPFSSRPVCSHSQFSVTACSERVISDSSAVVPEVEEEESCVGPPPYDQWTSMEGDGVSCYKCKVYRTNSWDKLHTHLRSRCLNTREKALLFNSYVHVQAKKELRLKAQVKRLSRQPLASPPAVSESETQPSPPTGPDTLPDEVPRVPTSTPDVLSAAVLQQESDSTPSTPGALPAASSLTCTPPTTPGAVSGTFPSTDGPPSTPGALPGASAQTESPWSTPGACPWSTPGALPRVPVTEEPSARDAIVMPPPATGGPVAVTAPPPSDVCVAQDGTCWTQTQACYM